MIIKAAIEIDTDDITIIRNLFKDNLELYSTTNDPDLQVNFVSEVNIRNISVLSGNCSTEGTKHVFYKDSSQCVICKSSLNEVIISSTKG